MEWLGHSTKAMGNFGKWNPIKLAHIGPNLSHLFFADDLVIFSRADIKLGLILKNILDQFSNISEHRVNAQKANMFFSRGVDEDLSNQLSRLLGF